MNSIPHEFLSFFTKGNNCRDFLFVSLNNIALSKSDQLFKERKNLKEQFLIPTDTGKIKGNGSCSLKKVPIHFSVTKYNTLTELLIREGIEDSLKIIVLISQRKHMLLPLIRTVSMRRF